MIGARKLSLAMGGVGLILVLGLRSAGSTETVLTEQSVESPFVRHGKLRIANSGTYLEHTDGTPFFFLADTVWCGPALSTAEDWRYYLADRKKKGFTAIQFNAICPWRAAPTDREGRTAYRLEDGKLLVNEDYFRQLEERIAAIQQAGLLAVPVLVWAHKKGDAGFDLSDEHVIQLIRYQVERYEKYPCLFILAGDARYTGTERARWQRIGRAVFASRKGLLVTTHPTGMNFPWKDWENESWLNIWGYQSGHGDDGKTWEWLHSGPPAAYGRRSEFSRPLINLEPPYEGHNGYQSRKPHTAENVRRAAYWSLLVAPPAGLTYGAHGLWSWQTESGKEPRDHPGSGIARTWKEALEFPGATQMGYLRRFFESLPWTQLRPAPDFIQQQSAVQDPSSYVACARTPDGQVTVVYFPPKAQAQVRLHVSNPKQVRWYNPREGTWLENSPRGLLVPPDEQDWLRVVKT
jgi:hypothetical protein